METKIKVIIAVSFFLILAVGFLGVFILGAKKSEDTTLVKVTGLVDDEKQDECPTGKRYKLYQTNLSTGEKTLIGFTDADEDLSYFYTSENAEIQGLFYAENGEIKLKIGCQ